MLPPRGRGVAPLNFYEFLRANRTEYRSGHLINSEEQWPVGRITIILHTLVSLVTTV